LVDIVALEPGLRVRDGGNSFRLVIFGMGWNAMAGSEVADPFTRTLPPVTFDQKPGTGSTV
jgi:hypothetical protein